MKLYNVKDRYINYIKEHDHIVLDNKNEQRPYVGVVCTVGKVHYYVPLSSPKPKHAKMKNAKDFHKIAGGRYGTLNFNNMIPVEHSQLIEIDITNHPDALYRELLRNQHRELVNMQDVIYKKAAGIYSLYLTKDGLTPSDKKIKDRCCNFPLLEEKMEEYCSAGQKSRSGSGKN